MTAEPRDELLRLRAEMDAVNARLAAVLHDRARLCRRIAAHKRAHGLPLADPARERQMLEALLAGALQPGTAGGFAPRELEGILRAVFAASRRLVEGTTGG
jgi:chorismate mutase